MQWRRKLTWNPGDLGWRIAALFMVGSFLFALGSFPPYPQLVDGRIVGITFVIGSAFFTTAGYSVFFDVINDGRVHGTQAKFWAWSPRPRLWWAAFVQLIGTLSFNANTIDAMFDTFTVEETNRLVWGPDFAGCIAFLVASHLYWLNVCNKLWCTKTDNPDWWGSLLNYIGSIAFMASAVASFTLKTTGETINITIVNSGTFVGAVCFLIGAYLGLPPVADQTRPQVRSTATRSSRRDDRNQLRSLERLGPNGDLQRSTRRLGRQVGHRVPRERAHRSSGDSV